MRFLALGDSYTIGEGVEPAEGWPVQLADLLRARGVPAAEPVIIAETGWTTDELAAGIEQAEPEGTFDLATLLIGANDQYRGRGVDDYRAGFRALLGRAIRAAGGDPKRVLVLSIPDWGVTPFAEGRDREQIAREIERFNAVVREETRRATARRVGITPASRRAATDPTLVADDGLHVSAKMYALWAESALPSALAALGHGESARTGIG